jgi:glycosyltransferase involved in cell wall biosynthesis
MTETTLYPNNMSGPPKVTVVTVVRNAKLDIERTIRSVIDQDYEQIEYIVVDGDSTDGTYHVITRFETRISTFLSEPDRGIYDAMNKGIRLATGDWILFLNAGDEIYSNTTIREIFDQETFSGYHVLYGDLVAENSIGARFYAKALRLQVLRYRMAFGHPACLVKASVLKARPFSVSYRVAADYDFMLRLYLSKEFKFYYLATPIAFFQLGGVSTNNPKLVKEEHISVIRANLQSFTEFFVWRYRLGCYVADIKTIAKRILGNKMTNKFVRIKYR